MEYSGVACLAPRCPRQAGGYWAEASGLTPSWIDGRLRLHILDPAQDADRSRALALVFVTTPGRAAETYQEPDP